MRRRLASATVALSLVATGTAACGLARKPDLTPHCPTRTAAKAKNPGLTGHIAVVNSAAHGSLCDGIWVMNADGSGARPVTGPEKVYFEAELSPDGRQIAFEGQCGTERGIPLCIINTDGTDLRRVLDSDVSRPAWSPDGQRLAVSRSSSAGTYEIFTTSLDGADVRQVTHDGARANQPSWSPDGRSIAYVSDKDGSYQIYRVALAGGAPTLLGQGGSVNQDPAWSHDGRHIAFTSNRSGKPDSAYLANMRKQPGSGNLPMNGSPDIFVMDADGSHVTRLTSDASANRGPAWSPDDAHLVFTTDRELHYEAYVMEPDGTGQRRAVDLPGGNEFASWSA